MYIPHTEQPKGNKNRRESKFQTCFILKRAFLLQLKAIFEDP